MTAVQNNGPAEVYTFERPVDGRANKVVPQVDFLLVLVPVTDQGHFYLPGGGLTAGKEMT